MIGNRVDFVAAIRLIVFQAIKYGGVGSINASVTILIMLILGRLGVNYLVYTAIGYFGGFVSSYLLNGLFTFRVGRISLKGFLQFVILNLPLLLGVDVLEYLLIEHLGMREVLGVAIGMVTYTGVGFVLNRMLIFRPAPH